MFFIIYFECFYYLELFVLLTFNVLYFVFLLPHVVVRLILYWLLLFYVYYDLSRDHICKLAEAKI